MKNPVTSKKDRSRDKILSSAGSLLREKGVSGTSVSEVMGGAGMTVGGFYSHFSSKQELVAEAISEALCQSRRNMAEGARDLKGEEWVTAVARSYLSRFHRDHPEAGCPLPTTLGEISREEEPVREALAREVEETVAVIAAHLEEAGAEDPRAEALALFSAMIGGLTLARALQGSPLSDATLKACRHHIKRSLP